MPPLAPVHCPNCNAALETQFRYCYRCGQDLHPVKAPFKAFCIELLEGIFNFDNKIWHTLKNLFISPGIVIRDFNNNKKARYVPPLRLYIFLSFIYFLLVTDGVENNIQSVKGAIKAYNDTAKVHSFQVDFLSHTAVPAPVAKLLFEDTHLTEPKLDSLLRSHAVETDAINNKIILRIIRLQQGQITPKEMGDEVLASVSKMVFLLMPTFALIVWLVCGLKKIFYAEAFVFSMYFHSFYILLLTLGMLLSRLFPIPSLNYIVFGIAALYLVSSIRFAFQKKWTTAVWNSLLVVLLYSVVFGIFFTAAITMSLVF